jgi:hypothetical protein
LGKLKNAILSAYWMTSTQGQSKTFLFPHFILQETIKNYNTDGTLRGSSHSTDNIWVSPKNAEHVITQICFG